VTTVPHLCVFAFLGERMLFWVRLLYVRMGTDCFRFMDVSLLSFGNARVANHWSHLSILLERVRGDLCIFAKFLHRILSILIGCFAETHFHDFSALFPCSRSLFIPASPSSTVTRSSGKIATAEASDPSRESDPVAFLPISISENPVHALCILILHKRRGLVTAKSGFLRRSPGQALA
jgi:hypothetical protein